MNLTILNKSTHGGYSGSAKEANIRITDKGAFLFSNKLIEMLMINDNQRCVFAKDNESKRWFIAIDKNIEDGFAIRMKNKEGEKPTGAFNCTALAKEMRKSFLVKENKGLILLLREAPKASSGLMFYPLSTKR